MKTCPIPFVFFKRILWMDCCEPFHDMISTHLCENGSCLNLGNKSISTNDVPYLSWFYILEFVIISTVYFDEPVSISYLRKYLPERFIHSESIRLAYPDLIDNLRGDNSYSTETISFFDRFVDHGENELPFLRRELLGIVEQR